MNKIVYVLPVIIATSATFILKLLNTIARTKVYKSEDKTDLGLMRAEASYDEFKRISGESLSLNGPVRTENDFFDFIIQHINPDVECIENRILIRGCDGNYE